MRVRRFLNQMVYYSYDEDRMNYIIRCKGQKELETNSDNLEILGIDIISALASCIEWKNKANNQIYMIPYENIVEILNKKTGKRIIIAK
jgi:hypothetical protein